MKINELRKKSEEIRKQEEILSENKKILEEISRVKKSDQYSLTVKNQQLSSYNETITSLNKQNAKEIQSLEERIKFLLGIKETDIPKEKWVLSERKSKQREACVISVFSDAHYEERVTKDVTNGLNEYNLEIGEKRTKRYFEKLIKLTNKERKDISIKKAVIGLLGDNISGYIHQELMQNNILSPTEAVIFCIRVLQNGIMFLADNGNFESIEIVCKFGNHARTTPKKTFATGYKNNYEWMMYHILKQNLQIAGYDNVHFIIENGEFTYTEVFGKTIRWCHGDHFNYRGGVGGIEIPLKTWLYKMNKQYPADMTYLAHWHDYIRTNDAVINPSVMGLNAYGLGFGFPATQLRQHFELLDSERGFTINCPIWLQ